MNTLADSSPIIDVLTTSVSGWASSMTSAITSNAPVILTVIGGSIVLMFGIKFIKRLTSKA